MTDFEIIFVTINGISIACMVLIIAEYWHVHRKRITLMEAMESNEVPQMKRERYILTIFYGISTFGITAVPLYFLLY